MSNEELPFKIVRTNGSAEVIVGGTHLLVGRDAFDSAARLYPKDLIELRNGAQVIGRRTPYDET
jgi:hypothetical protein